MRKDCEKVGGVGAVLYLCGKELNDMATHFEEEWQKMLGGQRYDAFLPEFHERLISTREKIRDYNNSDPRDTEGLRRQLRGMLGSSGEHVQINQPFRCDYGCNIHVGEDFFANFNFTVLDEAEVRIGSKALIGPNVSIYTACHPLERAERDAFIEWAEPVTIGDSVWIGGGSTILPGVTIGSNVVVGAGSVVTKDVPDNVVVAGNPAKIIRRLAEE